MVTISRQKPKKCICLNYLINSRLWQWNFVADSRRRKVRYICIVSYSYFITIFITRVRLGNHRRHKKLPEFRLGNIYNRWLKTNRDDSATSAGNISNCQSIQNFASKIVTNSKKFDLVTPLLRQLNWLPVKRLLTYKDTVMTCKCLRDILKYIWTKVTYLFVTSYL